ncbi:hypothetical protein D3C80_1222780 [compost metagenome]
MTGSLGRTRQAVTAISSAAVPIQTMMASGEARVSSAPMPTFATTKAAEPQPRGREKSKPARLATRSVMTSLSGISAAAAVAPTNQQTAQAAKP